VVATSYADGAVAVRGVMAAKVGPASNAVQEFRAVSFQEMPGISMPETREGTQLPAVEREVVRCGGCGLTQFVGRVKCPRCFKAMPVPVVAEPEKGLKTYRPITNFGTRLRSFREAAALTQEELGSMSRTSRTHISRMESSKQLPTIEMLERMAVGMKCSLAELLDDTSMPDLFGRHLVDLVPKLTKEQRNSVINTMKVYFSGATSKGIQ